MPDLDYPEDFTADRDNVDVNSWAHVYEPLVAIRTLLNDTKLDSGNVQQYGLTPDRMAADGAFNGPYIKVYAGASAIPALSVCSMTGAIYYDHPLVTTAISSQVSGSTRYGFGIAPIEIAAYSEGVIATNYELTGLNTGAAAAWAPVFLSTVAGGYVYSLPAAGYRVQMIGFVSNPSTTTGRIQFFFPGHIIPWSIADQVL